MRVFFAIDLANLPDVGKLQAAYKGVPGIRWVAPPLVHITLRFLGEIAGSELSSALSRCRAVATRFSPFSLEWDRTGVFPNWRQPRILWVGVADPSAKVIRRIGDALGQRDLHPHVTMGRVRGFLPRESLARFRHHEIDWPAVDVREIVVMRSNLTPEGPVYAVVGREQLRGHREDKGE